jgi:hypothetical protein
VGTSIIKNGKESQDQSLRNDLASHSLSSRVPLSLHFWFLPSVQTQPKRAFTTTSWLLLRVLSTQQHCQHCLKRRHLALDLLQAAVLPTVQLEVKQASRHQWTGHAPSPSHQPLPLEAREGTEKQVTSASRHQLETQNPTSKGKAAQLCHQITVPALGGSGRTEAEECAPVSCSLELSNVLEGCC